MRRIAPRTMTANIAYGQMPENRGEGPTTAVPTVTVHSRLAESEPSETVTFTTYPPGVPEKLNAFVFPPTTAPFTRHV